MSDDWKCPPDRFPIMGPNYPRPGERKLTVPLACVLDCEAQARRNHGQSVAGLKSRGGLSWSELCAVLEGRDWKNMDLDAAHERAMNIVLAWMVIQRAIATGPAA